MDHRGLIPDRFLLNNPGNVRGMRAYSCPQENRKNELARSRFHRNSRRERVKGTQDRPDSGRFHRPGHICWQHLGGQLSNDIGGLFSGIDSDSAVANAIFYALIITIFLVIAAAAASLVVRKVLTILLMGWADKLAGGALGIAAGAVISAGVIMGMANLTYGSEVADEIATKVLNSTLDTDRAKARLEEGLTHSAIVDTFLDVVDVVPSSTFGSFPTTSGAPWIS